MTLSAGACDTCDTHDGDTPTVGQSTGIIAAESAAAARGGGTDVDVGGGGMELLST